MKQLIILIAMAVMISACDNATTAKRIAYYADFKIELIQNGAVVRQWESSGRVYSETSSDGFFFKDKATGKLVQVSGQVVITQLN